MSMPGFTSLVMAAGKSTRMKSRYPKPAHEICGQPILRYILQACADAGSERTVVVIGHQAEAMRVIFGDLEYAYQTEQKGTGHAVICARDLLEDRCEHLLVLPGDIPLITGEALRTLAERHFSTNAEATLLTAQLPHDAGMYGRVIRDADMRVVGIVEAKDATPDQLRVREINTSVYLFRTASLFDALERVRPDNAQGEYYLTDVIADLVAGGRRVEAISSADWQVALGVNTRVELADLARRMRDRTLTRLMLEGVTIEDPGSTYIDPSVQIGTDTIIRPNTYVHGATVIGSGCDIGPCARILNCTVGDDVIIVSSQLDRSRVSDGVRIGPFANVRPGCVIGPSCKIGDFVELKNAVLEEKVSAGHLTYLGDAVVGARTNVGAGTITCNYDGKNKHQTTIGKRCFIGSDSVLVAPVELGDDAYVAAGSVITDGVPEGALGIARGRQVNKTDWVAQHRLKLGQ